MLQSMTGFGAKEKEITHIGQISVELRSLNYKFFESQVHMPEGFLFLEERIKKAIEAKVKRGRVTCVINIAGKPLSSASVNKSLLKNYLGAANKACKQLGIEDRISIDTLINLPGVLSVAESQIPKERIWPRLETVLKDALGELVKARLKEGRAVAAYLKRGANVLDKNLNSIKARFKLIVLARIKELASDEERTSFLKASDINEEIERLQFHIKNFSKKLQASGPIGKELDFVLQEMQREANTMGAKSCDIRISGKVVQLKSQIEKLREQIQNVE